MGRKIHQLFQLEIAIKNSIYIIIFFYLKLLEKVYWEKLMGVGNWNSAFMAVMVRFMAFSRCFILQYNGRCLADGEVISTFIEKN